MTENTSFQSFQKPIMNTIGRMPIRTNGKLSNEPSFLVDEHLYLSTEDKINQRTGKLIAFTKLEKNKDYITFRSDSHLYPAFWAEGSIKISDIDKDGWTKKPYKINGRASDNSKSQLYASIKGWVLRLDDSENLPFWAECSLPHFFSLPLGVMPIEYQVS
jgi:hypothetical protein